jgi:hypothetical protein
MKTEPGSALDRLLTLSLIAAPVIYLIADSLYAARGWDDPTAAVFHVLGAIAYTFLLLRVVTWSDGILAAVLLFIGAFGVAGNVAYGFNTIHVSLGDTDLVDTAGAATLIKPLGLCFPLMLLLTAAALRGTRNVWISAVLAVAGVAWPVAHIANIAWLAVLVNAALVVVFSALTVAAPRAAADPVKEPVGTA